MTHEPAPGHRALSLKFAAALFIPVLCASLTQAQETAADRLESDRSQQALEQILEILDGLEPDERAAVLRRIDQRSATSRRPEVDVPVEAETETASAPVPAPEPEQEPIVTATGPDLPSSQILPVKDCELIAWLDATGDGRVSGADRHWRHLYLWIDDNGNHRVDPDETARMLDYDIRSIDLKLRTYEARGEVVGDIRVDELVEFRLVGKARRRASSDRAVLVIDSDDVRRSGPSLMLRDPATGSATRATGLVPLRPGLLLERDRAGPKVLTCDAARP